MVSNGGDVATSWWVLNKNISEKNLVRSKVFGHHSSMHIVNGPHFKCR
jgi:hypothetical protein